MNKIKDKIPKLQYYRREKSFIEKKLSNFSKKKKKNLGEGLVCQQKIIYF